MAHNNTSLAASPHYFKFDGATVYPLNLITTGPGRNPDTAPRLIKCLADGNIVVKRLSDGVSVTIPVLVGQEEDIQATELTSATAEGMIYW